MPDLMPDSGLKSIVHAHEIQKYNRLYIVWRYEVFKNCDIASISETIELLKDELVGKCVLSVKGYRSSNSVSNKNGNKIDIM